eukprot:1392360-Amphidinium_carterae.1
MFGLHHSTLNLSRCQQHPKLREREPRVRFACSLNQLAYRLGGGGPPPAVLETLHTGGYSPAPPLLPPIGGGRPNERA